MCKFPFGKRSLPVGRHLEQFSPFSLSFADVEKVLNLGLD